MRILVIEGQAARREHAKHILLGLGHEPLLSGNASGVSNHLARGVDGISSGLDITGADRVQDVLDTAFQKLTELPLFFISHHVQDAAGAARLATRIEGTFGIASHAEPFGTPKYWRWFNPINMMIRCSTCNTIHVDEPEPYGNCHCGCSRTAHLKPVNDAGSDLEIMDCAGCSKCTRYIPAWRNPPHVKHLCHLCGKIFHYTEACTNGVMTLG